MFAALKIVKDVAVGASKAIIGYAQDSLDAYADLEKHVASASNVFGKNFAENREAIESFSRSLAKTMPYSASETADALYYLGLTGLDLQGSMDVVDQMLKLAYVDGGNVQETVDMITDAMSGLRMEINRENTTAFMDELTTVMSSTNTNAQQALEAILGVGATAQMIGMTNNELGATLGVLANYGTKGSEAGTAVNSMITRMVGNSTAIGAYDDLGVKLYDKEGQFRGLSTILSETADALDKLTDEDRNPIMKDLFGIHYMNEGNILLSAMQEKIDETGQATNEYLDVLEKVGDAEGSLEGMYQNQLDTLDAQKKIASQQWYDLKISLGKALEPAYVEVLKWINSTFFPAAEDSMDVITGIIQENLPNIPVWLDKAKDIIQPVLDGLPDKIQTGWDNMKGMAESAQTFLESEKWEEIKSNLEDGAEHFGNALADIDWDKVGENAKSLYEAGVSLVDGATNIVAALSAVVDSPVGKFIGGLFDVVFGGANDLITALTGGDTSKSNSKYLQKFKDWISGGLDSFNSSLDKWQGSSPNEVINSSFSELSGNQFAEASKKVEKFKEDIITVKQDMGKEDDPKKIKVYQESLRYLNRQLDDANAKLLTLQQQFQTTSGVAYPSSRVQRSAGNAKATPFADGGIVTRPTLSLIGEAGEKEAVIPLSKIGDVVRNVSGGSINYAPVINVSGGGNAEGVKAALSQSYQEFKANYQRMVKESRRVAFTS